MVDNRERRCLPQFVRHLVRSVLHVPPCWTDPADNAATPKSAKKVPPQDIFAAERMMVVARRLDGQTASCSLLACGREGNESGRFSVRSCPTYFWTQQHGVICKWSHSQSDETPRDKKKIVPACAHAHHRAILSPPPPRCCGMVLRGVDFAWSISDEIL